MKTTLFFAAVSAILGAGILSSGNAIAQTTFHKDGSRWVNSATFQCELTDYNAVIWADGGDSFTYFGYEKLDPSKNVKIANGRPDCGMGKCRYDFKKGNTTYELLVNTRKAYDPPIPLWTGSLRVKNGEKVVLSDSCRNPADAIFMCSTKNRTIYVTKDENDVLGYRTYDYNTSNSANPSLSLTGGKMVSGDRGGFSYVFANNEYSYKLSVNAIGGTPGAGVAIAKNGEVIGRESCSTYTIGEQSNSGERE